MPSPAIYRAEVSHTRTGEVRHRLRHSVFYLFLDLGRLDETAAASRVFSCNRFNLLSFYDRDHGARDARPVKKWVEEQLKRAGLFDPGGRVFLLTLPRILGYVFNPLSIYYCFDSEDRLTAVLHEVRNTFGELHGYLLPAELGADGVVRQETDKRFHVSPFIGMAARYHFRLSVPGETVDVRISQTIEGGGLKARLWGRRHPFNDRELLAALASMPLMTFKVMAAILWHGAHLWLKKASFHRKPEAPAEPVTFDPPQPAAKSAEGDPKDACPRKQGGTNTGTTNRSAA